MNRASLSIALTAVTVIVACANAYLALYLGDRACGSEFGPPPNEGSPLDRYCGLFESPDDRISFLTHYGPFLVMLIGAALAIASASAPLAKRASFIAIGYLAVLFILAVVLPK